jgi:hypothetical protein
VYGGMPASSASRLRSVRSASKLTDLNGALAFQHLPACSFSDSSAYPSWDCVIRP